MKYCPDFKIPLNIRKTLRLFFAARLSLSVKKVRLLELFSETFYNMVMKMTEKRRDQVV